MKIKNIAPKEAMELYGQQTLEDYQEIKPFVEEYLRLHPNETALESLPFCALMAFNAGRVEGIRAEREGRKLRRDKARLS